MKLLLLLSVFVGVSASAQDDFIVTKNGQEYLCTATSPSNPNGAADCAYKARYSVSLSTQQASELCRGATSIAPADCAYKARYSVSLNSDEAVKVCTRATSVGPADCAYKARYSVSLSTAQAILLCERNGSTQRADCAYKARYSGGYSSDEAVDLCRAGNLKLLMRTLNKLK